jgi:hypothetical protein
MSKTWKPILCVDFDGVIHSYTRKWENEYTIPDPPVPGALEWLCQASKLFTVTIYSSRSKSIDGINAMREYIAVCALDYFGDIGFVEKEFMPSLVFAHEKPAAFLTIDDRAICFEGDFNDIPPARLLDFKPWNKR